MHDSPCLREAAKPVSVPHFGAAAPHSRHLHARRHQQGRVLPPAGPAARRAGAGPGARRAAAARDRQPRPVRRAHRRHGRRHLQHQQVRDPVEEHAARTTTSTTSTARCRSTRRSSTGAATAATSRPRRARSRISNGLVDPARVPRDGTCTVRIWQANIGKTIIAHVPVTDGQVQETGDFELDGVTFPAAEIVLEFIDPSDDGDGQRLDVPHRQPRRRPRGAGRRHVQGDDDQRRHPDGVRQRRGHRLHRHRTARGHQRRPEAARALRADPRRRRAAHGPDQDTRGSAASASTRRRSRSSRRRRITSRRAGARSRPATSTCSCARCRWASCTTR